MTDFLAFQRLLEGKTHTTNYSVVSPAIERFQHALSSRNASELDLAVLIRQVLAREFAHRGTSQLPVVLTNHRKLRTFESWHMIGLTATKTASGTMLTYTPWCPTWLDDSRCGVDVFAASETIRREFNSPTFCYGDPMLSSVGRKTYRSVGQRSAVRAALSTPPGSALIVALPTGEGKSLVFQLIHKVGFVEQQARELDALTLVIVPTVSLGINHEKETSHICELDWPLTYRSKSDKSNRLISEKIVNGSQGICFASPEAACGPLRESLRTAASYGKLRAIVIDEAHLVDQWGTDFRTDFQELSSFQSELMDAAPKDLAPRTIMLSATLTDTSELTLRTLFGYNCEIRSISAVQLRSEPDFWVAKRVDPTKRSKHIVEAIHHLPRPLILYVTKVDDATQWLTSLRSLGFSRVRTLHGNSKAADREKVVHDWRQGLLDIVVGTSAFGLGIDYPHVRSIVHACVPETLDRFYQEVGRGGRDGCAAISLIVPTTTDYPIAKRLNSKKVISTERGFTRWKSMFRNNESLGNSRFAVRIDIQPSVSDEDIDMKGSLNTEWNLRTLIVMSHAGIIRLLGKPKCDLSKDGEWFLIELLSNNHLDLNFWHTRFEPVRKKISKSARQNFELMRRYLDDKVCPADIFTLLYGLARMKKQCSRCNTCRNGNHTAPPPYPDAEPKSPWLLQRGRLVSDLLGHCSSLLINYEATEIQQPRSRRRLSNAIDRLQHDGLANLLVLGNIQFSISDIIEFANNRPFFVSLVRTVIASPLPQGPCLIVVGEEVKLNTVNLRAQQDSPRLFLMPTTMRTACDRRVREIFEGRRLNLMEFCHRIVQ